MFQRAGLIFSILLLAVTCTRFLDLFLTFMRIPMVLFILAGTCALLNIWALRVPSSAVSLLITAYTCWMAVTIPFSVWRSGSVSTFYNNLYALVLYAFFATLIVTFRETLRVMYTLGASALIAACLGLRFGTKETGRLAFVQGNFADPNDYALMLLLGLPFLCLFIKNNAWHKKVAGLWAIVPVLIALLQTGSRGGLIAFAVLLFMLFLGASLTQKVMILGGVALITILSFSLMPNQLKVRYMSFAITQPLIQEIDQETLDNLGGAIGSMESRLTVLMASIRMTIQNPVFGVGPGNFPSVMWDQAALRGRRSAWLVTHNTYTQVSSETGIPGLVLLLAVLFACLKAVNSILKAKPPAGPIYPPQVVNAAFFLRACIVSVSVGCLFLSMAYTSVLYILAMLAAALQRTARQQVIQPVADARIGPPPNAPRLARVPRPQRLPV